MNKKFEIPRDKLLEIKHSNYELYQLICSFATNEEEKDYCEMLDKTKLAKECELGYFNIDDLFTREQICNAYYQVAFKNPIFDDKNRHKESLKSETIEFRKEGFISFCVTPEQKEEFSPDHYSYLKEEFTFESAKKLAEDFKNDASFSWDNEKEIKQLPFPTKNQGDL